jgi:hypothetical protein
LRIALTLAIACTTAATAAPGGAPVQAVPLASVMNAKVSAAEQLLRPVVIGDFAEVARQTARLRDLTRAAMAAWQENPDDRYLQQATALVQSIQEMRDGVRMRDAERVSVGYAAMLSACVQCHQLRGGSRRRVPPSAAPQERP